MPGDLERLYQDAKSALKARDHDRASALLRQILVLDENYRDASRLLAQAVRLRRRRWYNDPRFWGMLAMLLLIGLGVFLAPKLRTFYAGQAVPIPSRQAATLPPTLAATSTAETLSSPTPIPLVWKRISLGTEFSRDFVTGFEIDPNDPEVLYARLQSAGYYRSIDGGLSWQPTRWADAPAEIQSRLIVYKEQARVQMQGQEVAPFVVANVGPDGTRRLYRVEDKTGGSSWWLSADGGTTWSQLGEIAQTGNPKSVAIAFDTEGSVYAYCASFLCKYSADGKDRIRLGAPAVGAFSIIGISPNDPRALYVAGYGVSVSRDGGLTWIQLDSGLGSARLQLDVGFGNSPALYMQAGQCSDEQRDDKAGLPLYTSENGGVSWNLSLSTGCYLVKDADQTTMYRVGRCYDCGGTRGWIWRSQDAGRSWEKVPAPGSPQALAADPTQAGSLHASLLVNYQPLSVRTAGQRAMQSTDHGTSWQTDAAEDAKGLLRCRGLTPQLTDIGRPQFLDSNWPMAIDPRDGDHVLYIVRGLLFESMDRCTDDNRILSTAPPGAANSITFDPNQSPTLYAGTDHGAYISTDNGQSWGQINDGLLGVDVVYSIAIDKDGTVYAATPYGVFRLETK